MNDPLFFSVILAAALSAVMLYCGHGKNLFNFPFLFSAVWVAFILVSYIEFVSSSSGLFYIYLRNGTIYVSLIIMFASILFGYLGYWVAGGGARRSSDFGGHSGRARSVDLSLQKRQSMHLMSCLVAIAAVIAFLYLATLGGGLQSYIFASGAYTITYEGLPVYLVFVIRFIYISIVIQLWLWSRTRKKSHLILALLFSVIPFINIFFVFRRSEVLIMGITYGYFIANYTRVHIGRIAMVGAVLSMVVVLEMFPILRGVEEINFSDLARSFLAERESFENSEIGSAMFRIHATNELQQFEYGAIFWNAFVNQFVPSGIFGGDFKSSLLIGTQELEDYYFADFKYYLSPMGFAQSYAQFWYFGAVLFGAVGFGAAKLEQSRHKSARLEVFYVLLMPALLSTVSADMSLIVSRAITFAVLVLVCVPRPAAAVKRRAQAW